MDLSDTLFRNKTAPLYLKLLNYTALAGILAWPVLAILSLGVLFSTHDLWITLIKLILLLLYPIPVVGLSYLSYWLYPEYKLTAVLVPVFVVIAYISFLTLI